MSQCFVPNTHTLYVIIPTAPAVIISICLHPPCQPASRCQLTLTAMFVIRSVIFSFHHRRVESKLVQGGRARRLDKLSQIRLIATHSIYSLSVAVFVTAGVQSQSCKRSVAYAVGLSVGVNLKCNCATVSKWQGILVLACHVNCCVMNILVCYDQHKA